MKKLFTILFFIFFLTGYSQAQVRISQIYGGGGNSGATYNEDFIEIFNAGMAPVDISGWSVQYASAAGTSWAVTAIPALTSIGAGKYFLVGLAITTANGVALPGADVTGATNMSATSGKVALVNNSTALSGSTGSTACGSASVVDVVGYGSGSCFEGTVLSTSGIDNTKSMLRKSNGCIETNDNGSDFAILAVTPRNSASPASPCAAPTSALTAGPAVTNLSADVGITSTPGSFNLSGTLLTGFPGNITVTSPAGFEVSLSSGSGFAASVMVPFSAATLPATPIYVQISAAAIQGAVSGTVNISGGGAPSITVNVSGAVNQNYSNTKANNGLNNVSTWSTTVDGTGPSPVDFITPYQVFNIINQANANVTGPWDVTTPGNTSKVVVGDGISPLTLTIPTANAVTATTNVDVLDMGTLVIQNNTLPLLKNLASGSTVDFAETGLTTADTIKVPAISYYNLTLSNGIKILSGGTTTTLGTLILDQVINFNGAPSPFSTINSFGDINLLNGTTFEPSPSGDANRLTLALNAPTQTITSNGTDLLLFRLRRDSTAYDGMINLTGSSPINLVLGNNSGGGLQLNQGASSQTNLNLGQSSLTLFENGVSTASSLGQLSMFGGSLNILKSVGTASPGVLRFSSGSSVSNLTMNLGASVTSDSIIIANDLSVVGLSVITLTKGKIVMAPGTSLTLTAAPTFNGASPASFIDGTVIKGGTSDFTVPVGKGKNFAPVSFANLSANNVYSITYSNTGYGNYTIDPATSATNPAYNVSKQEFWQINRIFGGTVDITFNYTDAGSNILNPAAIRIAHFDNTDWNDLGGTPGGANTTTSGNVTITGVSTFSPFTFGATTSGVLPINLTNFTVQKSNNVVNVNWTTAQEINSNYFIVQRSTNRANWKDIGTVLAAGNSSSEINYSFIDKAPLKGINYYQLKQVDKDAKTVYSATKSVLFNTLFQAVLSPNPVSDVLNVYLSKTGSSLTNIYLYDSNGKLVKTLATKENVQTINVSGLAKGLYFIKIANDSTVETQRVVVQ
ncbi:MAG: T9SS type A sorting domain-containing protein [Ferruginibacter sp.]